MRRATAAAALLVCAACVASVAPFLRLFEFSNGGENAVVATVQELHRGHGKSWLIPTLHDEARTKKPPLAAWISALAVRPGTIAKLSDPDPGVRAGAYTDLGGDVRWPALVAMVGVLGATCVLGNTIGGPRLGLVAIAVCGSSLFWLRNARIVTTDAHLALWVSVANCLLATVVFNPRRQWLGLAGGGAALGLAMMSKGPVALLQTVLPIAAFLAWQKWKGRPHEHVGQRGQWLAPLLVGFALFALIGLSWYVLVLVKMPTVIAEWRVELTREGATSLEPSRWYNYVFLLGFMMPWTFFLIVGLIGSATLAIRGTNPGAERGARIVLVLSLLLVPIVVMSFFRDREIRYLIPLLAPSSVLAAWGLLELIGNATRSLSTALLVAGFHWLPLAVIAIGLPLMGALGSLKTVDNRPWYPLREAIFAAEVALVLIVVTIVLQRRWRVGGLVTGTFVVMLLWSMLFNIGYRNHREGRSEMRPLAEQILAKHRGAKVYSFRPDRPIRHAPIDLSIYLNDVVENVRDPAELAKTSGHRVYVVRQKDAEPLTDPSALAPRTSADWQFMSATRVDNAVWYAFVTAK